MNVRHPASPLARLLVQLEIRAAKAQNNHLCEESRLQAAVVKAAASFLRYKTIGHKTL